MSYALPNSTRDGILYDIIIIKIITQNGVLYQRKYQQAIFAY